MVKPSLSRGEAAPRDEGRLSRILVSALEAFAEQGYHATSIRDIASRSGLSVPGLYHHYRSKQDILMDLVVAIMDDLLGSTRAALEGVEGDEPTEQFDAVVSALLRFHLSRRVEAFVASSETRSLDPDNRERYVAMRDEQQQMVTRIVSAGCERGVFATAYPEDAARSIATLCVGVATWYREDGPLSADDLVARHLTLARALVGAH